MVIFNKDKFYSDTYSFENKDDFFEHFEIDEYDCEGFSWVLWEEGQYNRVRGNGNHYHLIKLFEE